MRSSGARGAAVTAGGRTGSGVGCGSLGSGGLTGGGVGVWIATWGLGCGVGGCAGA